MVGGCEVSDAATKCLCVKSEKWEKWHSFNKPATTLSKMQKASKISVSQELSFIKHFSMFSIFIL